MRPIRMKLKGINSFLELQEIDFELLTSRGLFGIFGPTGSGKSSILDSITLALYGTTARNSTNFIHVSTDRASVEYTFSVKEKKERIYQVSRSFKRSKEGTVRSDSARFAELTDGNTKILADRVGTVNEKCRDVLGLSREDFFRTVVLPQGKFSEFLKLEGMERNKMLERLFHLEKYGEKLAGLVKERALQWSGKKQENEGALSRYMEMYPEQLETLQKKSEELQLLAKEKEKSLKQARLHLEEGQKAAALEQEYQELSSQAEKLKKQQQEILKRQEEEQKAQTANRLWEYLQETETAKELWETAKRKQEYFKIALKDKQTEGEKAKKAREIVQMQIQTELPALKLEQVRLQEVISLSDSRKQEEMAWKEIQTAAQQSARLLDDSYAKMEKLVQDIEHRKVQKEHLASELAAVTVTAQKQQEAEEGYRLSLEQRTLQERKKVAAVRLQSLSEQEEKAEVRNVHLKQLLAKTEADKEALAKETQRLTVQQKNLPEAETQKEYYLSSKAEQEKAAGLYQIIETQKMLCEGFSRELLEKKAAKEKIAVKKEILEKHYLDNLAAMLSTQLEEGKPCPVCGSLHHEKVFSVKDHQGLVQLTKERDSAQESFQSITSEISRLELSLENGKEKLQTACKDLESLNSGLLQENLSILEQRMTGIKLQRAALEQALLQGEENRISLEQEILKLQTEKARAEAEKVQRKVREQEILEELQLLKNEEEQRELRLQELKKQSRTENFIQAHEEIQKKNKLREEKQKQLSLLETALEARMQNKEKGNLLIQETKEEKTRLEMQAGQHLQKMEELAVQIAEKSGTCTDPQSRCLEIEVLINRLQQSYIELTAQTEELQKEEDRLSREYTASEALMHASSAELQKKQTLLLEKMQEYHIPEKEWIELHKREETELLAIREQIENYQEASLRVHVRLEEMKRQRSAFPLPKESLNALEAAVLTLEETVASINKEMGALKQQLEHLRQALTEKEILEKEAREILHKLDILSELESLFRGKRFVEYVSRYYLEYVSWEADTQLKEMTGSNYGLETDGNGMFIIRDYKNGGVSRPASTLSGGETFMASLALALALSSQIQMKGAAPLEFFFLDEGFGTLDEACLDVVMESLEKIQNRQRSVGIITHVEEIKARIPLHLIVEPARMGEGGSKVHIEEG